MKIMGMDIGDKRIGIALSDEEGKTSIPHKVLENNRDFSDKLLKILDKENIEKIIVGIPYTLKGEIGNQAEKVIDFVKNNLLSMGVEVVYQDERFTSSFNMDPKVKKKKIKDRDKFSAALILQGYLDRTLRIKRIKDE